MRSTSRAYIGLGANLGDAPRTVRSAIAALDRLADVSVVATSRLYRSKPVGPPGQPDYMNAVVSLDTALAPLDLLASLQAVERDFGRERGVRWGARTLDLDILLIGDAVIATERLTVPHPHLAKRAFVLWPLLDIAPDVRLPDGRAARALAEAVGHDGIVDVEPMWPDEAVS